MYLKINSQQSCFKN